MGGSGCRVACPSQVQTRRSDEREREAGADEDAHFRVRPLPFGREARGEPLRSSVGVCARYGQTVVVTPTCWSMTTSA
jgi:hypothetical protein